MVNKEWTSEAAEANKNKLLQELKELPISDENLEWVTKELNKMCINNAEYQRVLTKRDLRNELFGILAMCDAFVEEGSMVGGKRKEELVKYLPKQIAKRLMDLQDLIEECKLVD